MHLEIARKKDKNRGEKKIDFLEELSLDMVGLKQTPKTRQWKEKEPKRGLEL